MARIFNASPGCDVCADLEGNQDGDGWDSSLGYERDLWFVNASGEWERKDTAGVLGAPPFHPNCVCTVV